MNKIMTQNYDSLESIKMKLDQIYYQVKLLWLFHNPINDYETTLNTGMKVILKNKNLSEITINL